MEAKDIKKKGMNGVKMVIFGRTLIVLGAFLIQFLFVYLLYRTLEEHSLEVYGLFRILMVVVLLHLLSSSGNPEFRLVWMLPMVERIGRDHPSVQSGENRKAQIPDYSDSGAEPPDPPDVQRTGVSCTGTEAGTDYEHSPGTS